MSKATDILGIYNDSDQGPKDTIWTAFGLAALLIESINRVAEALEVNDEV